MGWTKELPTTDGWYWIHLDFGMTTIEYISEDEYYANVMWVGVDSDTAPLHTYLKYNPIFYGPLERPEMSK